MRGQADLLSFSGSLQTRLVILRDLWSQLYDTEGYHTALLCTYQLRAGDLRAAYLNFSICRHAPHLYFSH